MKMDLYNLKIDVTEAEMQLEKAQEIYQEAVDRRYEVGFLLKDDDSEEADEAYEKALEAEDKASYLLEAAETKLELFKRLQELVQDFPEELEVLENL